VLLRSGALTKQSTAIWCVLRKSVYICAERVYSGINSTKSPASGAGNVSEPMLMSQSREVREVVSLYISGFLQSERCGCQCLSAYAAAARDWGRRAVRLRWRLPCKMTGTLWMYSCYTKLSLLRCGVSSEWDVTVEKD